MRKLAYASVYNDVSLKLASYGRQRGVRRERDHVWVAVIAIGLASLGVRLAAQRPTGTAFTLAFEHRERSSVQTFEGARSADEATGEVSVTAEGKEAPVCGGDGPARQSVATGRAAARLERASDEALTFVLSSDAQSRGGFRTVCNPCLLETTCLKRTTESSYVNATANSLGQVTIHFDRPAAGSRYAIAVGTQDSALNGAQIAYRLDDGSGQNLLEGRTLPATIDYTPKPDQRLVLHAELTSEAESRGAAVSRNASGFVRFTVAVQASPLVGAERMPAMLGETSSQQPVKADSPAALVLLRGATHCGATLIGRQTALTAARCVSVLSYGDSINLSLLPVAANKVGVRSISILGNVKQRPARPRVAATDDLALLHLSEAGTWSGAAVERIPGRTQLAAGASVTVDGFVEDGSTLKPDRRALTIARVDDTTIALKPASSACGFTIGAGVFVMDGGTPRLVGVITGAPGGSECRASRVEPYLSGISEYSR